MAKVVRVNGRGNESMWTEDGEIFFHSGGRTHKMTSIKVTTCTVTNVEEARKAVKSAKGDVFGAWTGGMESANGKTSYVVLADASSLWVMEINKSQGQNALNFVQEIRPFSEKELKEEKKEYAAIQTPLGAAFTVGSIICMICAMACVWYFELPLAALAFAAAAIAMFVNIK